MSKRVVMLLLTAVAMATGTQCPSTADDALALITSEAEVKAACDAVYTPDQVDALIIAFAADRDAGAVKADIVDGVTELCGQNELPAECGVCLIKLIDYVWSN